MQMAHAAEYFFPHRLIKFSFFPRTVSDWNKLSEAVQGKPSVESFRQALYRLQLIYLVADEPRHPAVTERSLSPVAGFQQRNEEIALLEYSF